MTQNNFMNSDGLLYLVQRLNTIITNKIGTKVDKKDGYSLISDTEIQRLSQVTNYNDTEVKSSISELQRKVDALEQGTYDDTELRNLIAGCRTDINNLKAKVTNWDAAYAHSQESHAPANAQANIIEKIKLNGTEVTVSNKEVDIPAVAKSFGTENANKNIVTDENGDVIAVDKIISINGTKENPIYTSELKKDTLYSLTGYIAYDESQKDKAEYIKYGYGGLNLVSAQNITQGYEGTYFISFNKGGFSIKKDGTRSYSPIVNEEIIGNYFHLWKYDTFVLGEDSWEGKFSVTAIDIVRNEGEVAPDTQYATDCILYPLSSIDDNWDNKTSIQYFVIPRHQVYSGKPFIATYDSSQNIDVTHPTYPWNKVEYILIDSDVPEWAKRSEKPTYTPEEVGAAPVGAQPNVIEQIKVNGNVVEPIDKVVDISIVTEIPEEYVTDSELTAKGYAVASSVYSKSETYSIQQIDDKIKGGVHYKKNVATYSELPTDAQEGDMYNVIAADEEHGINAGDNVIWNGVDWDKYSGVIDTSGLVSKTDAITNEEIEEIITQVMG